MSNFPRAFQIVVGIEAGYVNDPKDPGGETKWGVSKRAHPKVDIKNLTIEGAQAIYLKDYWTPLALEGRPWAQQLCIFDCAVNQGGHRAIQLLKDPAANEAPWVVSFQSGRALLYAQDSDWAHDGRGWMRRLITISIDASKP